jgi:hypothetical protein
MSEIHGAVGSYVTNALDGPELSEFEAHLAVCETCRREVLEFSETAAQLSLLAETPPPPALRSSILSAIAEVRPLPPEETVEVRADGAPRRLPAPDSPGPGGSHLREARVDELAVRRSRRATRLLTFAAAAALVIALALGGWVVSLRQDQQGQVAGAALEAQLLAAPDLKVVTTKMQNGGVASFRYSRSLDKAMFVGNGLAAPGEGKAYQLWTIQGAAARPDQLVNGGTTQKAWLSGDVRSADGAAVTIEPSTGSTTPTAPILASVTL